jgi:hypothetical protein
VVAVLRPEEVELTADRDDLLSSYVGRAVVEEVQFTGALERLRLRLMDNHESLQHAGGDSSLARIEATRSQPEQRALPLKVGSEVALGARRLHLLPTPLSSFVVHAEDDEAAQLLVRDPILATLAARMKTRVTTQSFDGAPVARHAANGVAVIAAGPAAPQRASQLVRAGSNEVLLLTGRSEAPRQICIYWMDDAARHGTLAVAASLLRHLPAEAICVAAAPTQRRDSRRAAALRALLDARSEARAAHALDTRTELLPGEMPDGLLDYLPTLDLPLLVLGASNVDAAAALLDSLSVRAHDVPVLLVFREAAT